MHAQAIAILPPSLLPMHGVARNHVHWLACKQSAEIAPMPPISEGPELNLINHGTHFYLSCSMFVGQNFSPNPLQKPWLAHNSDNG